MARSLHCSGNICQEDTYGVILDMTVTNQNSITLYLKYLKLRYHAMDVISCQTYTNLKLVTHCNEYHLQSHKNYFIEC